MDRAHFVDQQSKHADGKFAFTFGETEARARFLALAVDVYDFMASSGQEPYHTFDPSADSAASLLAAIKSARAGRMSNFEFPNLLIRRCEAWSVEYFEVRGRNPQLELRDIMQDISESHNSSSWPVSYEWRIQEWIDAGDPGASPPFDDRHAIVTPMIFQRLRELRQICGGWLYWDGIQVIFASEAEWQTVRAAQKAELEQSQRRWIEAQAFKARTDEIQILAHSDVAFWNALRAWELERETKRPRVLPDPPEPFLSGPVRFALDAPKQQNNFDVRPVDLLFAKFFARARLPDEATLVLSCVLSLRYAVRRELALDDVLVWPGGPGLGRSSLEVKR